jgi:hypothetical protein
MEPGLDGPDRDVEVHRDLGLRQAQVVVEDEDRSLLEGEPPEAPLELVAVVDGQDSGRLRLYVDVEDPKVGGPSTAAPGLGVALVGQDSVEPGLEAFGIPQGPHLSPRHDERGLDGVLGEIGVAQDPVRNRQAPVADLAGEGIEGLSIALLRAVDERSMHSTLLVLDRVHDDAITLKRDLGYDSVQSSDAIDGPVPGTWRDGRREGNRHASSSTQNAPHEGVRLRT